MRRKSILWLVLLVTGAIVAGTWLAGQASSRRLQAERDALRRRHGELLRLQAERGRLREALDEATRRVSHRDAGAAMTQPPAPVEPAVVPISAGLVPGEWTASSTWADRGKATAPAAVETVLWAAARGDIATLVTLLELDDVARGKAIALLGRLPAEERNAVGSPENLVALATMNNIPRTEAQVAWFHETNADSAIVGLLLGTAGTEAGAQAAGDLAAEGPVPPPMLVDERNSKLAFLTLHRSAAGWRLVVPTNAVDRMAVELSAPRR